MKTLSLFLSLLFSVAAFAQDSLPEMNKKILAYAESKMGNKVGDGICGTFVITALKKVDREWDEYLSEKQGRYGRLIDSTEVLPGDIVRFKGCVFSDGQKAISHIGIVAAVNKDGTIDMLDQNRAQTLKESVVELTTMDHSKLVKGRIYFYRYEKRYTFAKTKTKR